MWIEDMVPKPSSKCRGILEGLKQLCLINWSWWTDSKSTAVDRLFFMTSCQHLSRDVGSQAPPLSLLYVEKIGEPGNKATMYIHWIVSTCIYYPCNEWKHWKDMSTPCHPSYVHLAVYILLLENLGKITWHMHTSVYQALSFRGGPRDNGMFGPACRPLPGFQCCTTKHCSR